MPKPARTLPAFTPVPRKKDRSNGWSPEVQRAFIEALAETGSVEAACRRVNRSAVGAYLLRRHPQGKSFRKAWEAALDLGIQRIEDVAMDRALNGVEVPVYAYGKIIGTRRVYNDRLLMFMLRNRAPKRFAADGAKGMNAVDRQLLARMKKQWRAEWERERALLEVEGEKEVIESINARIDLMRERSEAAERMKLTDESKHRSAEGGPQGRPAARSGDSREDIACPDGHAENKDFDIPHPSEEMKKFLPGYRKEEEPKDPGPRMRTMKDGGWDD